MEDEEEDGEDTEKGDMVAGLPQFSKQREKGALLRR
jgi:hypothetical protein